MADPRLARFLAAADENAADHELNLLVEQHGLPLSKTIVGRKLRSYREDNPGRSAAADQEDVVADAITTVIERLRALRSDPEAAPIENFVNYAAAVIHSTCAAYLRRRYPERARLKSRLRYVFSTERRVALWTVDDGDLVCGLSGWRDRPADAGAERKLTAVSAAGAPPGRR